MDTILTELGDTLLVENVLNNQNPTPYNDISVVPIFKETFETTPVGRTGWLVGSKWAYSGGNKNMAFTP